MSICSFVEQIHICWRMKEKNIHLSWLIILNWKSKRYIAPPPLRERRGTALFHSDFSIPDFLFFRLITFLAGLSDKKWRIVNYDSWLKFASSHLSPVEVIFNRLVEIVTQMRAYQHEFWNCVKCLVPSIIVIII